MDAKHLHEPVDPFLSVLFVIQPVDVSGHSPVSQGMLVSLIILLNQLHNDLILSFFFCGSMLQPLVVTCTGYFEALAHPFYRP